MSGENEFPAILYNWLGSEDYLSLGLLLLAAAASYVVVRFVLGRLLKKATKLTETKWDDILANRGVFGHLAYLAPALVLYLGIDQYPDIADVVRRIISAYVAINVVVILNRLLSAGEDIYLLSPVSEKRPIKAFVQLAKLVFWVIGMVVVVSALLDKSPWGILTGIGALAAVLILVFRDTILSFVANIQIHTGDIVREGDWIEMPECGADGDVIEIALHTVKVRNFDKTIVTIPTHKLIDGSFKNWRGMQDTGGRRIKRSLLIDQTSVRFCDDGMMERLHRIRLLKPYLKAKQMEIESANAGLADSGENQLPVNRRSLTNFGTFRAYVKAYLDENTKVRADLTVMVRQLAPTSEGLPLEIYSFSNDTDWVAYEGIQADIFDHLLASLPDFDLRVFQIPTGRDLQMLQSRVNSTSDANDDAGGKSGQAAAN
jgi:miniconductance mechanosensitive channel